MITKNIYLSDEIGTKNPINVINVYTDVSIFFSGDRVVIGESKVRISADSTCRLVRVYLVQIYTLI